MQPLVVVKPIHTKPRRIPRPSNFPPAFEREVLDPIIVRNPYADFNRRYCDLKQYAEERFYKTD